MQGGEPSPVEKEFSHSVFDEDEGQNTIRRSYGEDTPPQRSPSPMIDTPEPTLPDVASLKSADQSEAESEDDYDDGTLQHPRTKNPPYEHFDTLNRLVENLQAHDIEQHSGIRSKASLQDEDSESSNTSIELIGQRQNLPDVLPQQRPYYSPHDRVRDSSIRDSMASSIGNISTASSESAEERKRIKKLSVASNASRRTLASDVNVNVTPERSLSKDASDLPEIRKYRHKFRSEILCGALWGVNLLVGTENGLYLLDRSGNGRVFPLITRRRFKQIDVLETLNVLVTVSGKYDKLRIYYL